MKIVKCNQELEDLFQDKKVKIIENRDTLIKRVDNIDVLMHIEKNRASLTDENYVIAEVAYQNAVEQIFAIQMKNYTPEYQTLETLWRKIDLNRKEIILTLYKLLQELRAIGVNYSDLHTKNILVNEHSDMKLIDLDGAHFLKAEEATRKIVNQQSLIIDMIYKLYIFKDKISLYCDYHNLMCYLVDLSSVFSERTVDFLTSNKKEAKFTELLPSILDEFEDQKCAKVLQDKVRKKAPNLL